MTDKTAPRIYIDSNMLGNLYPNSGRIPELELLAQEGRIKLIITDLTRLECIKFRTDMSIDLLEDIHKTCEKLLASGRDGRLAPNQRSFMLPALEAIELTQGATKNPRDQRPTILAEQRATFDQQMVQLHVDTIKVEPEDFWTVMHQRRDATHLFEPRPKGKGKKTEQFSDSFIIEALARSATEEDPIHVLTKDGDYRAIARYRDDWPNLHVFVDDDKDDTSGFPALFQALDLTTAPDDDLVQSVAELSDDLLSLLLQEGFPDLSDASALQHWSENLINEPFDLPKPYNNPLFPQIAHPPTLSDVNIEGLTFHGPPNLILADGNQTALLRASINILCQANLYHRVYRFVESQQGSLFGGDTAKRYHTTDHVEAVFSMEVTAVLGVADNQAKAVQSARISDRRPIRTVTMKLLQAGPEPDWSSTDGASQPRSPFRIIRY
ncbi:MAG: hypothetical protein Alpg2KO_00990 [Alphaproteobacteria bacterium]